MQEERWWLEMDPCGEDEHDSEDIDCECLDCEEIIPRDIALEWRSNLKEVIEKCDELYDTVKEQQTKLKEYEQKWADLHVMIYK